MDKPQDQVRYLPTDVENAEVQRGSQKVTVAECKDSQQGQNVSASPEGDPSQTFPSQNTVQSQEEACNQTQPCLIATSNISKKILAQSNLKGPGCFNCGEIGHFSRSCPRKSARNSEDTDQLPLLPVQHNRQREAQAKKTNKSFSLGKVNHVVVETILNDNQVILGMLMVNSVPASVLIDPRATHSFISTQFTTKHRIFKCPTKKKMQIDSPG